MVGLTEGLARGLDHRGAAGTALDPDLGPVGEPVPGDVYRQGRAGERRCRGDRHDRGGRWQLDDKGVVHAEEVVQVGVGPDVDVIGTGIGGGRDIEIAIDLGLADDRLARGVERRGAAGAALEVDLGTVPEPGPVEAGREDRRRGATGREGSPRPWAAGRR